MVADAACPADDRLVKPRLRTGLHKFLRITAVIAEIQEIDGSQIRVHFLKCSKIDQKGDSLIRAQRMMVAAMRADLEIAVQRSLAQFLFAVFAFQRLAGRDVRRDGFNRYLHFFFSLFHINHHPDGFSISSQVTSDGQHADRRCAAVQQRLRGGLQCRTRREDIVQQKQPTPRRTCFACEGVTDVALSLFTVHSGLLPRSACTAQAWHFRYSKPFGQQAGQYVRLVVASCQTAKPMQRYRNDSVQRLVATVCSPRIRKTFRQKRRQMKTAAIFELVNPMPRLSFKRKSGYRKPPWPVFVFQLALAAFVQQSVRRPSATGAPPLRQHGAFLQTFRAHLLFRRKHRPTAART